MGVAAPSFLRALRALCSAVPEGRPCVTVVIPAYRLEGVIRSTVEGVSRVLGGHGVPHELIIVDDGSGDGTAEDAVRACPSGLCVRMSVLSYCRNRGKGFALSVGALHATAPYTAFIDGDGDICPQQLLLILPPLIRWDAVITSKYHPQARLDASPLRKVLGNAFRLLTTLLTGVGIRDTQTGCKAFKTKLLKEAVRRVYVKRYAMDVELLIILKHLGAKILEVPAVSEIRLRTPFKLTNIARMLLDLLTITYRHTVITLNSKTLSLVEK